MQWEKLIDERLRKWLAEHEELCDEEFTAPSEERIGQAIDFAINLLEMNCPAPTRVVLDGHGGIVFEYRGDRRSVSVRIEADGSIECIAFQDGSLVERQLIA
jgi:hypothetical protein